MKKQQDHCCVFMQKFTQDQSIPVFYAARLRNYSVTEDESGTIRSSICFCPWCGVELPYNLNTEWFEALEKEHKLDDPFDKDQKKLIPEEFRSEKWWEKRGYMSGAPSPSRKELIKQIKKRDILLELYKKEITQKEANKIREKLSQLSSKVGFYLSMEEYLDLLPNEEIALINGISFAAIAKWRYEGWPQICAICRKEIIPKGRNWIAISKGKLDDKFEANTIAHSDCYISVISQKNINENV